MDELALHLNGIGNDTASAGSNCNANAVLLRQAGLANAVACVYLATAADGTMLPPMLALKVIKTVRMFFALQNYKPLRIYRLPRAK